LQALTHQLEELRPGELATFAGYVKRGERQKKLVEELRPAELHPGEGAELSCALVSCALVEELSCPLVEELRSTI